MRPLARCGSINDIHLKGLGFRWCSDKHAFMRSASMILESLQIIAGIVRSFDIEETCSQEASRGRVC